MVVKVNNVTYGVPMTIIEHSTNGYELVGHEHDLTGDGSGSGVSQFMVDGVGKFKRILIKRIDVS